MKICILTRLLLLVRKRQLSQASVVAWRHVTRFSQHAFILSPSLGDSYSKYSLNT